MKHYRPNDLLDLFLKYRDNPEIVDLIDSYKHMIVDYDEYANLKTNWDNLEDELESVENEVRDHAEALDQQVDDTRQFLNDIVKKLSQINKSRLQLDEIIQLDEIVQLIQDDPYGITS